MSSQSATRSVLILSSTIDVAIPVLMKIRFEDGAVITGPLKAVKFRVEFSSNLSSPSMGSSPRDLYPTGVTLIMEKGAHSTFKATYNRLRSAWECVDLPLPSSTRVLMRCGVQTGFSSIPEWIRWSAINPLADAFSNSRCSQRPITFPLISIPFSHYLSPSDTLSFRCFTLTIYPFFYYINV